MPRIGKRILKSALAVFLCFCIDLLRNNQGIPFYSAIAAIFCMQTYVSNSKNAAINRIIATCIGGVYGVFYLYIERYLIPVDIRILNYFVICAFIVLIIYTTVVINKSVTAYLTCVVFLSISISHAADINIYSFTINRMLDTVIGIVVSLGINSIRLAPMRNRDSLIFINLDKILLKGKDHLSTYATFKLNQMIEYDYRLIFMTQKNPCEFLPLLSGLKINMPVITMNGSLIYDVKKKNYIYCKPMSIQTTHAILNTLSSRGINCITYACIHDFLHIYYEGPTNKLEETFCDSIPSGYHNHYIRGRLSIENAAFSIQAVVPAHMMEALQKEYDAAPYSQDIYVLYYPSSEDPAFTRIEIYEKTATKEAAVRRMQRSIDYSKMILFAGDDQDIPIVEIADTVYVADDSSGSISQMKLPVINTENEKTLFKAMNRSI